MFPDTKTKDWQVIDFSWSIIFPLLMYFRLFMTLKSPLRALSSSGPHEHKTLNPIQGLLLSNLLGFNVPIRLFLGHWTPDVPFKRFCTNIATDFFCFESRICCASVPSRSCGAMPHLKLDSAAPYSLLTVIDARWWGIWRLEGLQCNREGGSCCSVWPFQ